MSYGLASVEQVAPRYCAGAPLAPGCPIGPYTIDDGQLSLPRRAMMPWGAWPDPQHPQVLYNNQARGVTMSVSQALTSLKYQAVAVGVGGLVVGGLIGYFSGRRRKQ